MKEILDKLTKLEMAIAKEKGPFDLFALALRQDGFDKWDLLASASWIQDNYNGALDYITERLNSALATDELITISKVVLIDEYDERLNKVLKAISVEHAPTQFRGNDFFGLQMDLVYVITSRLQIDIQLTASIWESITEKWKRGERSIYSGDVLQALKKSRRSPKTGTMRKALDFLINSNCIRAAKFVDRSGIREHGAMTITSVNLNCRPMETYLKDYMLQVVLREAEAEQIPKQWIAGIEYNLWYAIKESAGSGHQSRALNRRLRQYHRYLTITPEDIARLEELSKAAEGWCYWDKQDTRIFPGEKPKFVPMKEWHEMADVSTYLNSYQTRKMA